MDIVKVTMWDRKEYGKNGGRQAIPERHLLGHKISGTDRQIDLIALPRVSAYYRLIRRLFASV